MSKLTDIDKLASTRICDSNASDTIATIQHAAFVFKMEILCDLNDWVSVEKVLEVGFVASTEETLVEPSSGHANQWCTSRFI